jgi:Ser/Thr protein kinase RdoA (MazF antagonist)
MKHPFSARSQRAQIAEMRIQAKKMLRLFGWPDDSEFVCIAHAFNTTFRVRAKDRPEAALRINVNSASSLEHIRAETAFVQHLHSQNVLVPSPIKGLNGSHVQTVEWEEGRPLNAVLYSWIPGRSYENHFFEKDCFELGRLTQALHKAAENWEVPEGAVVRPSGDVLAGLPWVMPQVSLEFDLGLWEDVWEQTAAIYKRMDPQPRRVIHDDLHMWNLKKAPAGMTVFDFDDMTMGWPIKDAAVTLYYMRRLPDPEKKEAAYWRGLGMSWDDAGLTRDEFELMVGSRMVLLANDLAQNTTAELQAELPDYVAVADERLKRLMTQKVYRP